MEQALIPGLVFANNTAATLPADLNDLFIVDQHGHGPLPTRKGAHALARDWIYFDIVFNEFGAAPFEPLAHFLRVLAALRSEKFQLSHPPVPLGFPG
jgi:hypothetical protein